jgi:hypothetical protein
VTGRQPEATDHPIERGASGLVRVPDHRVLAQRGLEAAAPAAVVVAEKAEPQPARGQPLQVVLDLRVDLDEPPLAQRVVEVEDHRPDIARGELGWIELEDRIEVEVGHEPAQERREASAYRADPHLGQSSRRPLERRPATGRSWPRPANAATVRRKS